MSRWLDLPCGLRGVTGIDWPGIRYFCTSRAGGVSEAPWNSLNLGTHVGDQPDAVIENRRRLGLALPASPLWLNQVHGTRVLDADQAAAVDGARADAAFTAARGRVLAIMVADCLPVVLADDAGSVVGLAHAGWRGLAAGVLENLLAALRARQPAAREWRAWIGPGIGPDAFEVGGEVRAAFVDGHPPATACFRPHPVRADHWLADLAGLATLRLQHAGVARVERSGECTYRSASHYFSYRRQARTGRQALLAWRV